MTLIPVEAVFLDSGPVGLVTQRPGRNKEADACRAWVRRLIRRNVRVYLPEIADYEVRRELRRVRSTTGIARLDALRIQARFLPITSEAMLRAADLWAWARQNGFGTAGPDSLDADVILSAQVQEAGLPAGRFVVATVNVRHIARFVPAETWQDIQLPETPNQQTEPNGSE